MKEESHPRSKPKKKKKKSNAAWVVIAFTISFFITALLSAMSDKVVEIMPIVVSAAVLVLVISLGIVFDMIGLAVCTASIGPFNAMSSRKQKAGKKAVWLINNSEKVGSFCNDIVGDISGVVSGATGAGIAVKLFTETDADIAFLLTLCLTSAIAAITVGGKAMGKSFAIRNNTAIVLAVARVLCLFGKRT